MHSIDAFTLNSWHVVGTAAQTASDRQTRLLGVPLRIRSAMTAHSITEEKGRKLPVRERFGYLWTSLGSPEKDLFEIPTPDVSGLRELNAISIGIKTSALRAVENFLDLAHLPFVHGGILGDPQRAEVFDYKASINERGNVQASECKFFQPRASAGSVSAKQVEYIYEVMSPQCVVLSKSNTEREGCMDFIGMFAQAVSEEECIANLWLCVLDSASSDAALRRFQQTILAQDKPILENQIPKKLPLDPRAERPVRGDAAASLYRRWLRDVGVRYGAIA